MQAANPPRNSIGETVFVGCSNLGKFDGNFASSDGRCLIVDGNVIAFAPAGLTDYTIPQNATSIGQQAFFDCKALENITIPENVKSIGENSFENCSGLKSVSLSESLESIGSSAFRSCSSLVSLTIPGASTYVAGGAFAHCSSLESVSLPKSLELIEELTFYCCSSLKSISFPENLKTIGNYAFQGCTSLESLSIPKPVEVIGEYAFYNCNGLKSISIPSTIARMPRAAFGVDDRNCSTLEEFWMDHTTPSYIQMMEGFAYRILDNCKLYVHEGCEEVYAATWPWYNFGSILNGDAQSVDISESTLALGMGQSAQLFATVSPEKVFDPTLTWASSNTTVATVDDNGEVTAVGAGEATITATTHNGKSASCTVTVTKMKQEITWNQTFNDVVEGETITLTATASSDLEVTYEIQSGQEFASLSGNKLTILSPGTLVVVAIQAGDDNYEEAEPVTKEITAAAGIATISADDNTTAEYFTLQGLKVTTLTPGTLVIRLAAGKADKVLVK